MDFGRGHAWQVAILQDTSLDKVIKKSVKCGISECAVVSLMARIDCGQSVFWIYPDENLRNRFVLERIDQGLQLVYYYRMLAEKARRRVRKGREAADATSLKQLGSASVAFVASNSPSTMREFQADWLFIDELNECNQAQIVKGKDRLAHSNVRGMYRISNPSIKGVGIDVLYNESDQKEWFIKCGHCGERQLLDWFKNVVVQLDDNRFQLRDPDCRFLCVKCSKPIDRLGPGEWIAKHPGRSTSGYHISQLFSGTVTLPEMYQDFERGFANLSERKRFWNSVLGHSFQDIGASLDYDTLDRCIGDYSQQTVGNGCFIGCDPGEYLHVVVIDPQDRVIRVCELKGENKYQQLSNMMNMYRAYCVIEGDYDPSACRAFVERHRGRAMLCTYKASHDIKHYNRSKAEPIVKANRTYTMDESHAAIVQGLVRLPIDARSIPGDPSFYAEMCAPTRVEHVIESKFGGKKTVFVWEEGTNADDKRHGFNFAWLCREIFKGSGRGFFPLKGKITENVI